MTEAQRLKILRDALGLTTRQLAEQVGVTSIADVERGKVGISKRLGAALLEKFRVNPVWLIEGTGEMFVNGIADQPTPGHERPTSNADPVPVRNISDVPIVDLRAYAGIQSQPFKAITEIDLREYPTIQVVNIRFASQPLAFIVAGDSMEPKFSDGDIVICERALTTDFSANKFYVVRYLPDADNDGSVIALKQVKVLLERRIQLLSLNPDYPTVETYATRLKEAWIVKQRQTPF
jgi:phage repressor protein C with HTH and peptisase S24 domain